jgi:hypothetical protein
VVQATAVCLLIAAVTAQAHRAERGAGVGGVTDGSAQALLAARTGSQSIEAPVELRSLLACAVA